MTVAQTAPHYDVALVEAARAGDKDAIVSLLTRPARHPPLCPPDLQQFRRRQRRRAGSALADVPPRRHLQTITSLSAWLFAVVRRECWRLSRRMFSHTTDVAEMENSSLLSHRPPLELRADLANAIQSLPVHYRDVVLLRDTKR